MKVKIDNKGFDSARVPVAFVMSPSEKVCFYKMLQEHLIKKQGEPMAFVLAPADISKEVVLAWLIEAVPEFKIPEVISISETAGDM